MDTLLTVLFLWMVSTTDCVYRVSRQKASWGSAYSQCQNFGGRLAIIENLDNLRKDGVEDIGLDRGVELWVGAKLDSGEWSWEGETQMQYNSDRKGYLNKGCFHQQHWTSGSKISNLSPRACMQHCEWKGPVGLKKDYCMCDHELVNMSMIEVGVCHIPCDGSPSEMCGGLYGVSVYTDAQQVIKWAPGEPTKEKHCVQLRKTKQGELMEFVTGDCNMQIRALCSFRNDEKCGLFHACVRWTSLQYTWDDAVQRCQSLGGHLAEIDNTRVEYFQDLNKLPLGNFWLSLRHRHEWKWMNGEHVPFSEFFVHERTESPNTACAVVLNINDNIGLGARSCTEANFYLCQYDFMHGGSVPGAQRARTVGSGFITPLPPRTNTTSGSSTTPVANVENGTDENEDTDSGGSSMLEFCMYSFLGFVSGMVVVLTVGLIVYCVLRCKTPDQSKHQQLQERRHPHDNSSVSYSSRDDSVQIKGPPSDVTYDSVYDQGESPFRRTQRLIRMGSANTWRNAPSPKRQRSDTLESGHSDYTWRGMIGGKMEIINTQLRQPDIHVNRVHSERYRPKSGEYGFHNDGGSNRVSAECEVHHRDANIDYMPMNSDYRHTSGDFRPASIDYRPSSIEYRTNRKSTHDEITSDLDELEGYYDLPSSSGIYNNRHSTASTDRRSSRGLSGTENPSFIQLHSTTDDTSQEENIYATIKKTFQRMQEEMKEDQKQ